MGMFAPSLVILTGEILLFQRLRVVPFPYTVKIPVLDKITDKSTCSPVGHMGMSPPPILEVRGALQEADGFEGSDSDYSAPYMNDLVEDPCSSPASMSLTVLAIDTTDTARVTCDSTTIISKGLSNTRTVSSKMYLKRTVRVCSCAVRDANSWQYAGQDERPLMALGRTGKRATWAESMLNFRGKGGLVGFTTPHLPESDYWKGGEEQDSDTSEDPNMYDFPFEDEGSWSRERERMLQREEFFGGKSSLRRLFTPPIHSFQDITAQGFDESTATVAVGDSDGRVWVLNYGPKNAVR